MYFFNIGNAYLIFFIFIYTEFSFFFYRKCVVRMAKLCCSDSWYNSLQKIKVVVKWCSEVTWKGARWHGIQHQYILVDVLHHGEWKYFYFYNQTLVEYTVVSRVWREISSEKSRIHLWISRNLIIKYKTIRSPNSVDPCFNFKENLHDGAWGSATIYLTHRLQTL